MCWPCRPPLTTECEKFTSSRGLHFGLLDVRYEWRGRGSRTQASASIDANHHLVGLRNPAGRSSGSSRPLDSERRRGPAIPAGQNQRAFGKPQGKLSFHVRNCTKFVLRSNNSPTSIFLAM